ncbi:MAG: hydroxyisourate hydrolase [Candidatus Eisenbacteria bacterium]
MNAITTHVLDLTTGRPAAGVAVRLDRLTDGSWQVAGDAVTDADGRVRDAFPPLTGPGRFRLTFATGAWFAESGTACFHPEVTIVFEVTEARHHHVPLLLSPFGYSTYRGS